MSVRKPSHWPPGVEFTPCLRYHSSITPTTMSHIKGTSTCSAKTRPSYPVIIQQIHSACHPAQGQYGLFAAKKITPRTHILDYTGEIHCDDRPDSDYDLSLYRSGDGINVGIDASATGNEARFINDFRGIRARPNAIFVDGRDEFGELRMSIWSTEVIKKGEEILVSYGKSWWRERLANGTDIHRS